MVAGEFWKKIITEIGFSSCVLPIVSLQSADEVLRVIRPETGFFCVVTQILLKGLIAFAGHREIAGKNVVKRRNISRTLDRRVTAQGHDAAAGTPDVAEQQLQNRGGANDLHAFGMLRPSKRVTNRGGFIRA